jgi:hypothetical protein
VGGAIVEAIFASIMGIFFGTVIKSARLAIEVAPLVFVPFILFSGYTTNSGRVTRLDHGLAQVDRIYVADAIFL